MDAALFWLAVQYVEAGWAVPAGPRGRQQHAHTEPTDMRLVPHQTSLSPRRRQQQRLAASA